MRVGGLPRVIRQEEIAEFRLSERPDFLAEKTETLSLPVYHWPVSL